MTSLSAKLQSAVPSLNHSSGGTMEISKNRKSYTLEFKRQVINFYHAHAGNISLAAKMFGVDRKMVRNWVENEDFFRRQTEDGLQEPMPVVTAPSQPSKAPAPQRKRLERNFASGSAARYPELERSLAEWWTIQLAQGQNIKAKALKTHALLLFHQLYPNSSDQDFKASTGWLQRFVARMEAGGTSPMGENQSEAIAQTFPGRHSAFNGGNVSASSSADQGDNAAAMNPLMYWAAQQQGNLGMLFNQNQMQNSIKEPQKTPGSKKRSAADLVPIYPKPSQPSSTNLTQPSPSYHSQSSFDGTGGSKRNRNYFETPSTSTETEEQPTVKYVAMSQQDRAVMEQQKHEVDKFFQDCRDFLTYLEKLCAPNSIV